jgi:hypothetical protein
MSDLLPWRPDHLHTVESLASLDIGPLHDTWHAELVAVRTAGDHAALLAWCEVQHIRCIDRIDRQLADLAQCRLPAGDTAARDAFIRDRCNTAGGSTAVGAWAWFPWARTVVHVLAADDYHEVITNRNRDKLTREEQARLRTKTIAVVGLSVGGEAAVTVAQEHLCGHIVLADFDTLDLSNLNRLGAGIDDLGENKARLVARRIARLDPWIAMTIAPTGVTASNLDAILDSVDLLLEECDHMPMKQALRTAAVARRLDVIYAGDERGFLSIEPYSRGAEIPAFATGASRERSAFASPLHFFQALAVWLGGWDAISQRSRDSLLQVGATLCGYPQLASEARFAAGQLGHVARRLLLGEVLPAGQWQHDLELLIEPSRCLD